MADACGIGGQAVKIDPPFMIWNIAVEMTGFGCRAAPKDGERALKRLRAELGKGFDSAFRLRMLTARADTLEQLLEDWANERTRLGR
jgi:predicted outer membrane protein